MKYTLTNLGDDEGYAVHHNHNPMSDFAFHRINPLAATYPKPFPYGVGGIEAMRTKTKHKTLQSARIQMRRKDFECNAFIINSLTVADLRQAEKEEADNKFISNPQVRILWKHVFATSGRVVGSDNARAWYCGQMWGTCLCLHGPSLWMTINPSDTHDPIAQAFAGEIINLDDFDPHAAQNIARDPFTAVKYFFFIIKAILLHLFQINTTSHQVHSEMGVLGQISRYLKLLRRKGEGPCMFI
ncbi:hypothetical protein BDR03DRAFT_936868 [Suillus americanus]|nr:hypothetical protein BDR03DRAFT_936868 [Suillus americanus]